MKFLRILLLLLLFFFLWVYLANRALLTQPLPLSLRLPKVTILFFPPQGIRIDLLLLCSFLTGVFASSLLFGPWLWRLFRSQRELAAKLRALRLRSRIQGEEHPSESS